MRLSSSIYTLKNEPDTEFMHNTMLSFEAQKRPKYYEHCKIN